MTFSFFLYFLAYLLAINIKILHKLHANITPPVSLSIRSADQSVLSLICPVNELLTITLMDLNRRSPEPCGGKDKLTTNL